MCCFALFVCLTLLASFFLPSHLSFKNMYIYVVYEIVFVFWLDCINTYYVLHSSIVSGSEQDGRGGGQPQTSLTH